MTMAPQNRPYTVYVPAQMYKLSKTYIIIFNYFDKDYSCNSKCQVHKFTQHKQIYQGDNFQAQCDQKHRAYLF